MSRSRYDRKLDNAFYARAGQDQLIHGIIKARLGACERDIKAGQKLARKVTRLAAEVAQLKKYTRVRGRPPKMV